MKIKDLFTTLAAHHEGEDATRVIAEHLCDLLGSRRNEDSHIPEFGLPDFADLSLVGDYQTTVSREIRATVSACEPRLTSVVVKPGPGKNGGSAFESVFVIEGVLISNEGTEDQYQIASITRDGRVSIKE